ncbi:hypothetical protein [Bacillus sp. 179-C3.3 HS]|uniref:hypothetical protein n=1 Tax=Bacillus sp. 179-C3.3 HS TaxID=3232162 RepID=UPI0039A36769
MVLKIPRSFETSDKAHADLFNEMLNILVENDMEILEQFNLHVEDSNPHISDIEKKKWNESQLYKLTNDNGSQLINIPAGGSIYNEIRSLGACSFYAPGGSGVVDSPAVGKAALRGFQLVGQNNIGVGVAIDTSGNAFCFSYHENDIKINWLQLPTQNEKNKWDGGQLSKITADDGKAYERINANDPSILDKLLKLPGVHSWYIHEAHPDLPTRSSMRALSVFSENIYGWIIGANNTGDVYINRSTTDASGNQQEWSGWKRLNVHPLLNANGTRMLIPTDTDILTLPSGYYYVSGTNAINMPLTNDSSWFNVDIVESANKRKTLHIIRSYDNMHWFGTVHTDGVFKGWKKMLSDDDIVRNWTKPNLQNGWKQYVSKDGVPQTLQFTKNALGEVEIIGAICDGAIGFDTTAFILPEGFRPLQTCHFIGVASSAGTSGVPQIHRTCINPGGRVLVQAVSNSVNPTEFITFGFKFSTV